MITFKFDNKVYTLRIYRQHEMVEVVRRVSGTEPKVKVVKSKYPATYAKLYENTQTSSVIFAEAKVRCALTDTFTKAGSRLFVMRALSDRVRRKLREGSTGNPPNESTRKHRQQAFNTALWTAFMNNLREAREESARMRLEAAAIKAEKAAKVAPETTVAAS